MEIYRQDVNIVRFKLPEGVNSVTATASLNGGEEVALSLVAGTENLPVREFKLPYISDEGVVSVFYRFSTTTFSGPETVTVKDTYNVVTRILTNDDILEIHPNATDKEMSRIEKAVRHVINAHTGQVFGKFTGTYSVKGGGISALFLPRRLISITQVNGQPAGTWFEIDADGWILRMYPWGVPPIKADYFGLYQTEGGVIHNPNMVKLGTFLESQTYEITGEWGWEEVPAQVSEAAKLLVNDYACADQAYRDRYLTSMTAADWRIQFNSGAFLKTGNVRADQLLADYVLKRGWAVI